MCVTESKDEYPVTLLEMTSKERMGEGVKMMWKTRDKMCKSEAFHIVEHGCVIMRSHNREASNILQICFGENTRQRRK